MGEFYENTRCKTFSLRDLEFCRCTFISLPPENAFLSEKKRNYLKIIFNFQ